MSITKIICAIATFLLLSLPSVSVAAVAAKRANEPIEPIKAVTPKNAAEVSLGRTLFFDPRLSKSGFISCNSCHNLSTGGADNLPSSIGHKWNIGPINSPTVLNSSYNIAQFWDGRAKDLVEQAGGPVANPGEMGSTHELAIQVLQSIPGYAALFKAAYNEPTITMAKVQRAIAAFEETLVTPGSRFDQWLEGKDDALSTVELAGYQLFKEKGCVSCHNGPAIGGTSFQKFGLVKPFVTTSKAEGRYAVTKNESDRHVFKVPTLRNIELTYPYFHDGSVWTLEEAVEIMGSHQLGLELTKDEVTKIVAYLKTLTGKQPEIAIPILPPSGPDTPKPNPT